MLLLANLEMFNVFWTSGNLKNNSDTVLNEHITSSKQTAQPDTGFWEH